MLVQQQVTEPLGTLLFGGGVHGLWHPRSRYDGLYRGDQFGLRAGLIAEEIKPFYRGCYRDVPCGRVLLFHQRSARLWPVPDAGLGKTLSR